MTDIPMAKTRPASNWSAIWVLPLLALIIGTWLGWQAYQKAGIEIKVVFASAEGIQVGKTEFLYKGMTLGKVIALDFAMDGKDQGVIATLEVDKRVSPYLLSDTRFWLVKPSVTLAGITGLDTLVSGNYITASPGVAGKPSHNFVALDEVPPMAANTPGLHITLRAERLGSLNRDSPVFYKQIQVGRVRSYALAEDNKSVNVQLFIEPAYASLVRKHTRFWNASGITVDASLSGVKIQTESVASIVAGGISFATQEGHADSPPTDPSLPFRLYENFEEAQSGFKVQVSFPDMDGLTATTPVMFNGVQVGAVKKIKMSPDLIGAGAELLMDPRAEDYMTEGADFWVVKPSISLAGITGIDALVKGNYIAVRPGAKGAAAKRDFMALANPPAMELSTPGLHLVLLSNKLASLSVGSPVLFRQIKVGSVQSYKLSTDAKQVILGVHIEPEFTRLVNSSTRFWNASGVTVTGGLSGVEVKAESLQSLLAGGITFETPDAKAPLSKGRLSQFNLYEDREKALQQGVEVTITVASGDGMDVGTPIRYKGIDIGKVNNVELADDLKTVILHARILKASERIARVGSQFWVVKPEVSLTRLANLDTLVTGLYLDVQPAPAGAAAQTNFIAQSLAPTNTPSQQGLKLVLSTPTRGSIKPGVQISYRDIPVGKVLDFELGPTSDLVLLHVLIEPRYASLIHSGTRFWNTSGVTVDAGLFKGVKLRTDSLESVLEGGISFATPDAPLMGNPARPGQTFMLNSEPKDEWLQWAPKIMLGK
ncbi:MAG: MlaD family protein [Pseudomonadaceae bacterium]|nr:MlaD family protein [Pseudomonadaceae bacterium]